MNDIPSETISKVSNINFFNPVAGSCALGEVSP
jgi:hypothetical protein